jgi:hypothetical protein
MEKIECRESLVRILEGGKKIAGKEVSFYDKDILTGLTNDWQKGNKAMFNILGKMKVKTGDIFLLWRMIEMAREEKIEINGNTAKGWKDFEVRLKSVTTETISSVQ